MAGKAFKHQPSSFKSKIKWRNKKQGNQLLKDLELLKPARFCAGGLTAATLRPVSQKKDKEDKKQLKKLKAEWPLK